MAHPSESWWSTFLDMHGRDSTAEKAFLGYLYTHEIPAQSDVATLEQAYVDFQAYLAESGVEGIAPEPSPVRAAPTLPGPTPGLMSETPAVQHEPAPGSAPQGMVPHHEPEPPHEEPERRGGRRG